MVRADAEHLARQGSQGGVGRQPECEAVVHGRRIGEQQPFPLGAATCHRRAAVGEVQRQPGAQVLDRARRGEVKEWLLERHHRAVLARVVLPAAEQAPDGTCQDAPASVVLQRQLPEPDAQPLGCILVVDLLDALQLDEMVARPDDAEPDLRELDQQAGQLAPSAAHAPEVLEVQAAAFLDVHQVRRVDVKPVRGEVGALERAGQHLGGGQVAAVSCRFRQPFAHASEELGDRPFGRRVGVECHQRHAAVHRGAGEGGTDGVPGGDGDARGHLHLGLVVEVRKHHGRCGEVDVLE